MIGIIIGAIIAHKLLSDDESTDETTLPDWIPALPSLPCITLDLEPPRLPPFPDVRFIKIDLMEHEHKGTDK